MKVSFLVTYFNQEEYVRESLDSIISVDKLFDWEILVGDDGSSDSTKDIVYEYVNKYPKHIFLHTSDKNDDIKETVARASRNRLNLIRNMTGDFFCILDGDDKYCDTKFVEEALEIFNKYSNISIVAFGYRTFSRNRGILEENILPKQGLIYTKEYIEEMYIHAGACVIKNNFDDSRMILLNKVGFFDDNDILINSLYLGDLYSINKIVYAYRQTETSTYNDMDDFEKAILNVQGYDVDTVLLPTYRREMLKRYGGYLIELFKQRKAISSLMASSTIKMYYDAMSGVKNSCLKNYFEGYYYGHFFKRICFIKTILSTIHKYPKYAFNCFMA